MAKKKSQALVKFREIKPHHKKGNFSRHTDAKTIELIERRYQILELRRDGWNHDQIARCLGVSTATVSLDLKEILNNTLIKNAETTEENRSLQIERLDHLLRTYMPFATDSHREIRVDPLTGKEVIVTIPPSAICAALVLNIEARRAKLLALDVPETKKLEVTGVREYIGVDVDKV